MNRTMWVVIVGLWSAITSFGLWKAFEFERGAAELKTPPEAWPRQTQLLRDPRRPTLLVFIHPKCPCTRATLQELDRLLARHRDRATVYAIVLRPDEVPTDWVQTDLWSHAASIPGVQVLADDQGIYQRTFRMSTSGECLVYGADGKLRFHGGLTSGRGHEGYSIGQEAISAAILNQAVLAERTKAFGCPLQKSEDGDTARRSREPMVNGDH